jgi:quinoprotein glucose dehydrogenase
MGGSLLGLCDGLDEQSVSGPVYTPITEQWTIGLPSNMGAINWGGIAVDAQRGLIAVHTKSVPFRTKLIPRSAVADVIEILKDDATPPAEWEAAWQQVRKDFDLPEEVEVAEQRGADYLMARHPYLDPYLGAPCAGAPMGEMMVIDLQRETQVWRRPHGTLRDFALLPLHWGVPGVGGPLITSAGLIFIGGAAEKAIRAYDIDSGDELWHHRLPHPGNANPMTYEVNTPTGAKQFVVIAAGGDARVGTGGVGDYLVGFALPDLD